MDWHCVLRWQRCERPVRVYLRDMPAARFEAGRKRRRSLSDHFPKDGDPFSGIIADGGIIVSAAWAKFKRKGTSEAELKTYYAKSVELFETLEKNFTELKKAAGGTIKPYRTPEGGNLIFRPMGFQLLIQATRILIDQGFSLSNATKELAGLKWTLNAKPWSKLLWNPTTKKMLTATENQKLALALLIYGAGGELEGLRTSEQKLKEELDEVYGKSVKLADLFR